VAPPGVVVDDPLPELIVVDEPPVKRKPAAGG